jgi:hypothetical protein
MNQRDLGFQQSSLSTTKHVYINGRELLQFCALMYPQSAAVVVRPDALSCECKALMVENCCRWTLAAAIRQIVMDSHEHWCSSDGIHLRTTKGIGSIRNYNCKCTLVHLKKNYSSALPAVSSKTEYEFSGEVHFADSGYCHRLLICSFCSSNNG